ncbi:ABC transporter substrate-binding protein [Frateuria aurantia]|uniref:ABC-type dipeptide transport system, periplasmic component n=1 Tax=Frateuria aurantia (strain ATCC 33424 / DSM 6220 / KCTC 2777 / LMG 1558 / NBRC 3245 / NCIMB 13370) TaxID=767434 RepID=H8L1J1_FRAAD|nr:ABC transporter substrate-binding protein [Frateuria aurantia]AFC84719.1 ABC-type dipeptide transport system, periplasmic component [Frateuria aurantia DSM 6220]
MAAPWQGGTLVYATDREPLCLDPHVLGDMPQVFVASQYLDSLVSMDARGDIHPWLATDWSVSADGLSYTFHLRKDVHFTDGTPFNARALKANLDQITDPQTQSSTAGGYIRQYRGTDIVDDYTAVVHLDRPYAAFLEVLAQGFLGMESPRAMARGRDINCQSPVGSGPFKVVRWDRQSQVILSRNPDYQWAPPYAGHPGPAWLQRVVWKFIPEPSIRFASLEAGEVDVIEALPPEDEGTARRNPELSVVEADRPGNPTNGTFNLTRSPFNDRRVREAFVRAADVEGALHSVYFGQYHRAGGPLSPTTPFYRSDFEHAQDYDPLRAAKLLDQAGWTGHDADGYRTRDGHRLVVHALISNETAPAELTLWEQVQATTRAVGIDLRMDMLSASAALRRQGAWDYDIRVGYWNTNTADVLRIVFGSEFLGPTGGKGGFHQNSSGYHDPVLDGLLQQALVTRDASRRQGLYARAQQIVSAQYLQLTTYPQSTRLAVYHHAHGVRLEPSLQVSWLHDAWVSP